MLVVLFSLGGNLLHPDTFCDFPKPLYVTRRAKFVKILPDLETAKKIQVGMRSAPPLNLLLQGELLALTSIGLCGGGCSRGGS